MLLALLLLLARSGVEIEPRRVEWTEVESAIFRREWMLPDELWRPADAARSLIATAKALVEKRFDAPAEAPWMATLGDVVAEHRRRGATRVALDKLLAELAALRPQTHAELAPLAREVLVADAIHSRKWDPDVEGANDGMFFGALLERHALDFEPWNRQRGSTRLHQAATLIHADLDAITAALHDYRAAFDDPGTHYEKLAPRKGAFVVGESAELGPFAALRLAIRADLPFPFTHYDCDLRVLHVLDSEHHLVTYVFSPSDDFYWFAGRDVHFPVRTHDGEWVGTLLVRVAGFDLRGVPDDDGHRKSGTRAALGNLRRRAEAVFEASGSIPRTVDAALPPLWLRSR